MLGASGHLGNAILRELLRCGAQVTATGRRHQPQNLAGLEVEYRRVDTDQPGQLANLVEGHEWVIDAAAPYPVHRFVHRQDWERRPVEHALRRTDELLRAVARHGPRLTYIGSFVTLPRPAGPWGRLETALLRRLHPYFEVKQAIEQMVLEAGRGGLSAVVVCPTTCLGPWDLKPRELSIVPRTLAHRMPVAFSDMVNVIDVRDVARGVVAASKSEQHEPVALVGHNIGFDALVRWIAELRHRPPPRWQVPARLGILACLGQEAWLAAWGQTPPEPLLGALLVRESRVMTPSSAQARLGIRPRPLSETLHDAIRWYRSIGYC